MIKNTLKGHVMVLLAYVVLTIAMSWPVVGQMGNYVAGSGGDTWQTLWRFEHKHREVTQAFNDSQLGAYVAEEFLGQGIPRLVNLSVWPWMLFHVTLGEPLAYNIVWLLAFVLSGYAMYLLLRLLLPRSETIDFFGLRYFRADMAAFMAGVVYMFLPLHVAHSYGHFGAMQTQWLPFLLLAFFTFWRKPTVWKLAIFGFLLIVQAWTEHHYLLWFGIFLLIWLVVNWREVWSRYGAVSTLKMKSPTFVLGSLLALSMIGFLGVSLSPTLRLAWQSNSSLDLGREQLVRFSADLFAFVVPAPFHFVWGGVSEALFASAFTGNMTEATQFLGFIPLLLVIFFFRHIPSKIRKFWSLVAIVFGLIALGPQLHVFGRITGLYLPYDFIDSWPVLSSVRAVGRAGVFVGISLVVLLGYVLNLHIKRLFMAGIFLAAVLIEFLFLPMPTQSTELSAVNGAIRDLPGTSVLEIPTATNYTAASRSLYASLLHGKQVFGNIALERAQDPEVLRLSRSVPAVRQLLFVRTTDLREARVDFFNQSLAETLPDALAWIDARGIVVHEDSISELQTASIRNFLVDDVGFKMTSFGDAALYSGSLGELSRRQGSDGVFLMRDSGWENVGFDSERGHIYGEVTDRARITVVNTNSVPVVISLNFEVASESDARAVVTEAGEFVTLVEDSSVQVERILKPGEHEFLFEVTSGDRLIIQDPVLATVN